MDDKSAFSTDWEIDQVFQSGSGTINLAAGSGWPGMWSGVASRSFVNIPHDKIYQPLCRLSYKINGTRFQEAIPIVTGTSYMSALAGIEATWESGPTKVQLIFINSSNTAQTITYDYQLFEDNINGYQHLTS